MLSIMAGLGSNEFKLRSSLGAKGRSQLSSGSEDFPGSNVIRLMLSEGIDIELADFDVMNAMLQGDHFWRAVDIGIGGDPTVLEICFTC
jgi:hypothetical protein